MGIDLYGRAGLDVYERAHYSRGEHIEEVRQILSWLPAGLGSVLDIGCSAGLHALEFARRGFTVVGVDIEPFAVERARRRSRREGLRARFRVLDITRDDLSSFGRFDFVYSLGNVLSHIRKPELPGVLMNIRAVLNVNGLFLFDLLTTGDPFRPVIRDDYHRILWQRQLDGRSGKIGMDGYFIDFGISQHFDVWGYSVEEVLGLLKVAGFSPAGVSGRLDFTVAPSEESQPFCLNFRARPKEVR